MFSNTRQLLLNGWSGVLVEPSPSVLTPLRSLYKGRKDVTILPLAIGPEAGKQTFYNAGGDAVSSFDMQHVDLWRTKGKVKFTPIQMEVITWPMLFSRYGWDCDFLNLDAEAWSVQLLEVLPFNKLLALRMIIVEFDHQEDRVIAATEPHGFKLYHKTAENMIMVK